MMRKIVWQSLGAVLIVAGLTGAWTQTQPWHEWRGHFWFSHGPMAHVVHELGLSDAQKSQIKTIWEGERPNIAELLHEVASEQKEMDAITFQGGGAPDAGRIQDIATRQGATLAKLFAEKEKLTGEIYSLVLNPAQRAKADELRGLWISHLDQIADRISNATGGK